MNLRMVQFEVHKKLRGEERKDAEEDDENYARDNTCRVFASRPCTATSKVAIA